VALRLTRRLLVGDAIKLDSLAIIYFVPARSCALVQRLNQSEERRSPSWRETLPRV
jgi:hypothetical protein